VQGPASYFPSIEQKYGRTIGEWKTIIRSCGLVRHSEIVSWLKAEHAMGHGHANALVAHTLAEDTGVRSGATPTAKAVKPKAVPANLPSATGGAVTFRTTLFGMGNNTGIKVPDDVVEQLAAGQRPAVVVTVNGYEYRSTIAVMGGEHLIGVSAAIRKETGLKANDDITVSLTVATSPREVIVPPDFAAALQQSPVALSFFEGLANSLQRFHIDNINGAKSEDTRARRIVKAVELFLAGKKR
jgi:hypothetical protein